MKVIPRQNSAGIALIMVMCAIVVLTLMAAAFAYSMKIEVRLAANANSEQQMYWLGRSGAELARYVLAQQTAIPGEPYDSLNQIWAGGSGGPGETNSVLSGVSLTDYPVGDGTVSIKITDLERKVNINAATDQNNLIKQALTLMGVDADSLSVVSDSILDWKDPPKGPRTAGAEDDYYQALAIPYHVKNAPIDNLSELLLVRGVTPEMYWGSNATNHTPSVFQHKLGLGNAPGEPPDYPFGLVAIFTPISSGLINVNTADANVLQMIPGVDAAAADNIIKLRNGPDGVEGTEDDIPFRDPNAALQGAGVNNPQAAQLCTVHSYTFEVHITAKIGGLPPRDYTAIIFRRNANDISVLSFYWK